MEKSACVNVLLIAPRIASFHFNPVVLAAKFKVLNCRVRVASHLTELQKPYLSASVPELYSLMVVVHQPAQNFNGLAILKHQFENKASSIPDPTIAFYSCDNELESLQQAYRLGATYCSLVLPPPKDNLDDFVGGCLRSLDWTSYRQRQHKEAIYANS